MFSTLLSIIIFVIGILVSYSMGYLSGHKDSSLNYYEKLDNIKRFYNYLFSKIKKKD